jgi:hypothetical protein
MKPSEDSAATACIASANSHIGHNTASGTGVDAHGNDPTVRRRRDDCATFCT